MLNEVYRTAVKQPRWIKKILRSSADIGVRALSSLTGFKPAEGGTVMSYEMLFGTWDRGVSSLLKQSLTPGMTVIDVGAHVGYFALEASRLVGTNGTVHAFEPNKENFEKLAFNIKKYPNIISHTEAVSDHIGEMTFYDSSTGTGSNSLIAERGAYKSTHTVPVTTLDSLFGNTPVDLIKIDVEGAEHFVLKGMREIVQKNPTLKLVVELYPKVYRDQNLPGHFLLSQLHEMGFSVSVLDDESGSISEPLVPSSFETFVREMPKKYVNLYAQKTKSE